MVKLFGYTKDEIRDKITLFSNITGIEESSLKSESREDCIVSFYKMYFASDNGRKRIRKAMKDSLKPDTEIETFLSKGDMISEMLGRLTEQPDIEIHIKMMERIRDDVDMKWMTDSTTDQGRTNMFLVQSKYTSAMAMDAKWNIENDVDADYFVNNESNVQRVTYSRMDNKDVFENEKQMRWRELYFEIRNKIHAIKRADVERMFRYHACEGLKSGVEGIEVNGIPVIVFKLPEKVEDDFQREAEFEKSYYGDKFTSEAASMKNECGIDTYDELISELEEDAQEGDDDQEEEQGREGTDEEEEEVTEERPEEEEMPYETRSDTHEQEVSPSQQGRSPGMEEGPEAREKDDDIVREGRQQTDRERADQTRREQEDEEPDSEEEEGDSGIKRAKVMSDLLEIAKDEIAECNTMHPLHDDLIHERRFARSQNERRSVEVEELTDEDVLIHYTTSYRSVRYILTFEGLDRVAKFTLVNETDRDEWE